MVENEWNYVKYLFLMMVIMCDVVGFHDVRNKHVTAIIVFLYIKLPKK